MRSSASRQLMLLVGLVAIVAIALLLFFLFTQPRTPAATPSPSIQPTSQRITITAPVSGASLASPAQIQGTVAIRPADGALSYRVFDQAGAVIGQGSLPASGETGKPATFAGPVLFNAAANGPGRVEVMEVSRESGVTLAMASVEVSLQAGGAALVPTVTAAPGMTPQAIIIDTPAPGTQVGSPVVLTGRTARYPAGGLLSYRVRDQNGAAIGQGSFQVSGATGQPGSFNASLTFAPPASGGTIAIELYEEDSGSKAVIASSAVSLYVAPPQPGQQAIIFTSPAPGTQVGSPVVVTGRTARFPFQGSLGYRISDANGNLLGSNIFNVTGAPGQPATFNASLTFNLPSGGGPIRIEVFDQDASSGSTAASASLDLNVAPPPPAQQTITITSPAPGTQVGSPVVVTGRTAVFPFEGNLSYRVRDGSGNIIGQGALQASGQIGQPAAFNASITFTLGPGGGNIVVEIFEQDAATGGVKASATVALVVAPTTPPTAIPPTAVPQQIITITSPPPGTTVGSPAVITGRTTRYPHEGNLSYRVRDGRGALLGEGGISVSGAIGQPATFNAALTFTEPAAGGQITVEIYEMSQANGAILASTTINLQVQAKPQTQATSLPAGQQPITIETPPPGTVVGSPVVITGRIARLPARGLLNFRITDESGAELGAGLLPVNQPPGQSGAVFNASLVFKEPPGGGTIQVEVFDLDANGAVAARAELRLTVNPPPYPQPRALP